MLWLFALGGALLGGAIGGLSTWHQGEKEKEALERQKESARKQYELDKRHSDDMYSLQMGVHKSNLNTQLGAFMDDYNTSLLSQAFGIQDARIQTGSSLGASIAAEGAGGTRDDAANEMIRAYAAAGLDRNIDAQNRQNTNYLNQTADAINYEAGSWSEGGYRHKQKSLQDEPNKKIFDLGQDDYDWAIKQYNPENMILDYITGAFDGASSGFNLGSGIGDYSKQVGKNPWSNMFSGFKLKQAIKKPNVTSTHHW